MLRNQLDLRICIVIYRKKGSSFYDDVKKRVSKGSLMMISSPQIIDAEKHGDRYRNRKNVINENGKQVDKEYELEQGCARPLAINQDIRRMRVLKLK